MLSPVSKTLIRILFFLYFLLGLFLFFDPEWSSRSFAWNISPFVAMTIGAWCLGNAYIARNITRRWQWSLMFASLVYLWSFGILEALVLLLFVDKLLLTTVLAWVYVATLAVNVLASVVGITDYLQNRPKVTIEGGPVPEWIRKIIIVGILIVAIITLSVPANIHGFTQGDILPEKLSVFTMSAFAAFYLSLVIAGLTFIPKKGFAPIRTFVQGGIALTIPITLAALFHFRPEHFLIYQGLFIYTAAYLLILIPAFIIIRYRN